MRSAPGSTVRTATRSKTGGGSSGRGSDMARRQRDSGTAEEAARGRERALGGGEEAAGLTVDRTEGSASSGKLLRRRIDGGDLRAPEMKTTTLRSTGASSGRVRRVCSSTGSGRSSGKEVEDNGNVAAVGWCRRCGGGGGRRCHISTRLTRPPLALLPTSSMPSSRARISLPPCHVAAAARAASARF